MNPLLMVAIVVIIALVGNRLVQRAKMARYRSREDKSRIEVRYREESKFWKYDPSASLIDESVRIGNELTVKIDLTTVRSPTMIEAMFVGKASTIARGFEADSGRPIDVAIVSSDLRTT